MAKRIVQINFKYKITPDELHKAFLDSAPPFVNMKTLEWKIWLHDPAKKAAGGIYLFNTEKAATDFLNGDIFANVKKHPALENVEAKLWEIMPDVTKMTRGPV
jgi:hypothetical protein